MRKITGFLIFFLTCFSHATQAGSDQSTLKQFRPNLVGILEVAQLFHHKRTDTNPSLPDSFHSMIS